MAGPGRPKKDGAPPMRRSTTTKCQHCEGVFRSGVMFQRHILKVHPDEEKKNTCNICASKYCTMDELLHHYLKHWVEGGVCPLCSNSTTTFTRRARILAHLLEKHNLEIEDVQLLPSKNQINKSQRNVVKRYLCTFCKKAFDKPSQVKRHVLIHTGERPFECEHCGTRFNQKNALVLHMLTHTNSRPHKCQLCPESFNQRGNLRSHIKCCHPLNVNENRHFCPHCPSSFRNSGSLNMHHNRLHQNLTEDKIINNTVNDVMKGLAILNSQTQEDSDILQKALFCSGISSKPEKSVKHESIASDKKINNSIRSPNIKPFRCDICKKTFRQSVGLSLHQHNIHNIKKKNNSEEKNTTDNIASNIDDLFSKNDSKVDIDLSILPIIDYPSIYPLNNSDDLNMNHNESFQFMNTEIQNQKELNSLTDEILNSENQLSASLDLGNDIISIENILADQNDILSKQFNAIPVDNNVSTLISENTIFDNNSVLLKQLHTIDGQYYLETLPQSNMKKESSIANNKNLMNNSMDIEITDNFDFDKYNNEIITLEKGVDFTENIQDIPVISIIDNTVHSNEFIPQNPIENSFILSCPEGDITFMDIEDNLKELELQTLKKSLSTNQRGYKNPPLENRCEVCPASFCKMSDLIRHKRIHTGEKPFVCEICNRAFSIKNTYKRHLSVHVKKKPNVRCQVCGDHFANKTTHKIHMRLHTGVKPFKCPLCNEAFRTSGHRSAHLKVHFKTNGRKSKKYMSTLFSLNENDIK